MTQPVIFKKTLSVAFITLLDFLAPPFVAVAALYGSTLIYQIEFDNRFVILAALVALLSIVLLPPRRDLSTQLLARRFPLAVGVVIRWFVVLALLLAIGYATKLSGEYSRRAVVTWALMTPALLVVVILFIHEGMRRVLFDPSNARRVVFAGFNEGSLVLAKRLREHSEFFMSVDGFFDDRSLDRLGAVKDCTLLGTLPALPGYVKANRVDVIFIALPIRHIQRVVDLLENLKDTTASIYYVPDVFVFDLIQARTGEILGIPVVAMCETPFYGFRGVAKRLEDIVVGSLALIATLPLMVAIAVAIKATSPGPVVFRQRRYGLDGREIQVYKFRTMTVTEDGAQIPQATIDDERITPLGKFLRRYSLDELPQFINVLQGRMSIVGPRPHAVAHNEMYRKLIKGYMMRHKVLPGITGLAQVNGLRGETRSVEQMEARVHYDLEYLRNWSIILDLKIIGRTVLRLLKDANAY